MHKPVHALAQKRKKKKKKNKKNKTSLYFCASRSVFYQAGSQTDVLRVAWFAKSCSLKDGRVWLFPSTNTDKLLNAALTTLNPGRSSVPASYCAKSFVGMNAAIHGHGLGSYSLLGFKHHLSVDNLLIEFFRKSHVQRGHVGTLDRGFLLDPLQAFESSTSRKAHK